MAAILEDAARKFVDPIEHTGGMWKQILGVAGFVLGCVIAVALLATPVGWIAMAAYASTVLLVGGIGMFAGEMISKLIDYEAGDIQEGSPNVTVGDVTLPAARVNDKTKCHGQKIAEGCLIIGINQQPAARVKSRTECNGKVKEGCTTVKYGGPWIQVLAIKDPDDPRWYTIFKEVVDWAGMLLGLPGLAKGLATHGLKGFLFKQGLWKGLANGHELLDPVVFTTMKTLEYSGAAITQTAGYKTAAFLWNTGSTARGLNDFRTAVRAPGAAFGPPIGGGAPTGGAPTGGAPTGGAPTGGAPTGGAPTGGAPTGGAPTGGAPTGGAPTGGAPTGGAPTGGAPTGGGPTGGAPTGGAPTGGAPTGGAPTGGAPTGGAPTGGADGGAPPAGGPPAGGPDGGAPPAGGPPAGGPDAGAPPQGGPPAGGPDAGAPPAGGPPAGGPDAGAPPAGGPPAGGPDAGAPPAGGPPAGGPDAGAPPAGGPPAGGPDAGAPPAGGPPAGGPDAGAPPAGGPPAGGPDGAPPADKPPSIFDDPVRTPEQEAGAVRNAQVDGTGKVLKGGTDTFDKGGKALEGINPAAPQQLQTPDPFKPPPTQ